MRFPSIVLSFALAAAAFGADPVVPRKGEPPSVGLYVPVNLDSRAADSTGVVFSDAHVTVGGVPFDLVTRPGADNLFLKSAGWPDWKEDPSRYYSAYDSGSQNTTEPGRLIFKIPVADYSAVYLLAAADKDRALGNTVSFRIGALDGARRVVLHDFSGTVPRFDEARGAGASTAIPTKAGNVFLIHIPLGQAFAQDFRDEWAFDVEVAKELHLAVHRPDPCRFQIRPLGLTSGVHIYGMTFARAPVQIEVTSDERGHVFNEPAQPAFHVKLHGLSRISGKLSLEAVARDLSGETSTVTIPDLTLPPWGSLSQDIVIPVKRRGYHELTVRLLIGRGEVLRRQTTFAVLPADTRQHRDTSPFGTWDFGGGHYTPSDPDVVGPLYWKAGLRYGMFGFTAEARKKYGVLAGNEPRSAAELAKKLQADPTVPQDILVFHEHAISGAHVLRTPDVFTGRPPYKLDDKEQAKFDSMWKEATETAQAVREQFPLAKIAFGNGNPHLLEEFARHHFPANLFDSRGNEAGSFMRMPETQPLDFVANNASLWMDRQILDHYGYSEKPITQCYEICYPCTNPGNLSLHTQAAYYVRHMMHSLVWGIPVIRPACICDVGNSYYYSNWGACGLCFAKPELSAKPSYVAMATLTRVLDGAKFSRIIETPSPSLYAVEFSRPDAKYVSVFWTLRGTRPLNLECAEGVLTDLMGNDQPLEIHDGKAQIVLSGDPVFVTTSKPLAQIEPEAAKLEGRPSGKHFSISTLAKFSDWQIDSAPDTELEWFNFDCPRRKGDFAYANVPEFEGEKNVLSVKPRLPVAGSSYLPMYSSLTLKRPLEISGAPTEIGLMVRGNGGWGRVIFELTDASGQRWTSIGAAQSGEATRWMADWMSEKELAAMKTANISDWNTDDAWQRSRINFEGWRFLRFPLPGNYEGEGYHWPGSCNWKSTGDGVVKYPLTFRRLILELPEKVLHLNKMISAPQTEIYLKDLQVTYEAVEKAYATEP